MKERLIFEGPPPDGFVADLTSLNIQRGRGHGLPGYVKYRDACGLSPVSTFGSLAGTISLADRQRLKEIYTSPFDIDLFVGGILEIPLYGSILGPTFSCIFQAQFKNLRFGDRFWYERDDHQTGFTYEQLTEIRKSNIARVICDNANDVVNIQKRAFEPATNPAGNNPRFFCNELDFVNLNVFQEGKTLVRFPRQLFMLLMFLLSFLKSKEKLLRIRYVENTSKTSLKSRLFWFSCLIHLFG